MNSKVIGAMLYAYKAVQKQKVSEQELKEAQKAARHKRKKESDAILPSEKAENIIAYISKAMSLSQQQKMDRDYKEEMDNLTEELERMDLNDAPRDKMMVCK